MDDSDGRSVRRWRLPGNAPWRAVAGLVAALIAIAAIVALLRVEPEPGRGRGGTDGTHQRPAGS
jgi:hypothetical protein